MKRTRNRLAGSGAICLLMLFTVYVCALAEILTWTVATGDYGDAANWSPSQTPSPDDEVRVNNGGVAIIASGTHVADLFYAARLVGGSGHLIISGGELGLSSELFVAFANGTEGSVVMNGSSELSALNLKVGVRGYAVMDAGPGARIRVRTTYVGMHGPQGISGTDADGVLRLSGRLEGSVLYISSNGGRGHLHLDGGSIDLSGSFWMNYQAEGKDLREARLTLSGSSGSFVSSDLHASHETTALVFEADAGGFTPLRVNGTADIGGARLYVDADAYEGAETFHVLINSNALTGMFSEVHITGVQDGWVIYDHDNGDVLFSTVTNSVPLLRAGGMFHDHMVLQRDRRIPVWGRAEPESEIIISIDDQPAGMARSDADGRWMVWIGPYSDDMGIPHELRISMAGGRDLLIRDVVFGDVYVVSGQSNMQSLLGVHAPDELPLANYPLIRQIRPNRINVADPLEDPVLMSGWTRCVPDTANMFSGVGYFFAREIHQRTGVPIGLLFSAWSGAPIEQFINPEGMALVPELSGMLQYHEQRGGIDNLHGYYNGMIAPLVPYGVRGSIWYQGESNATSKDGDIYRMKMQALIRGWRAVWGQDAFSFYYVQLPNIGNPAWTALREAQRRTLMEPGTRMAVTIDVGEDGILHPPNKRDPGIRIALAALAFDFERTLTYSGPLFLRADVEGSEVRVVFDHAEGGLMAGTKEGIGPVYETDGCLQNFELAGGDGVYVAADAVIDADTVLVSSPLVSDPVHVRYAWMALFEPNKLYNASGLPASPFSTELRYELKVVSGSGSAAGILPGTRIAIEADSPPPGQIFDRWIGDASSVDDLNSPSAMVTMPDHDLFLLAVFRDASGPIHALQVNGGFGSGTSQAGSILVIEAGAPPAGQVFDGWSGDTATLVDIRSARTTLRMPASDTEVTAEYRLLDSVGDGITDEWRARYFGGNGVTADVYSHADADPDGDGATNLEEFKAGSDPLDPMSFLHVGEISIQDGVELVFNSFSGRRYVVEWTDRLTDGDWQVVVYNVFGDGMRKRVRCRGVSATGIRFFRLRTDGPEGRDSGTEVW